MVIDNEPDGCFCGDPDCPECGWCTTCGGDGYGVAGFDWPLDDPVNDVPGVVVPCPECGGEG